MENFYMTPKIVEAVATEPLEQAKRRLIDRVDEVLQDAAQRYGLPAWDVSVHFYSKHRAAGYAKFHRFGQMEIRLNLEAYYLDPQDMLKDTIPHEVAHLVCMMFPQHGKGHDRGWQYICRTLGGSGRRCHDLQLTPARKTRMFKYTLPSGATVVLKSVRHLKIQRGLMTYRTRRTGEKLDKTCPYVVVTE